jgi:exodeoxyribonuclease-1
MRFIFYDTETTGAERSFDQILQFAAALTDEDFNVVDRFEIRSRLLPYVVPSPGAMMVTGVGVDQLFDPSTSSHFEMIKRIHEVMTAWSPATVVGYNSFSFDEELLRRAFYCALLPVYVTNSGGNSRLDLFPIAVATHTLATQALTWPTNEKGRTSFKLDRLAPANGFKHDNAHDALDDVLATIHLARLIRDRAPAVWSASINHRTKAAATQFAEQEPVFIETRSRFGLQASRFVTALGTNPDNTGELFVLGLSQDPCVLAEMADDELASHLTGHPKPVSSIKLNASPIFVPIDIGGSLSEGHELGPSELSRRAMLVRNNPTLRHRLISATLAARKPFEKSCHVEDQIYDGFFSREDQKLMGDFHRADWKRRFELSGEFSDPRLRVLSRRIIYCEAPEALPPELKAEYARAVATRILRRNEGTGRWMTIDKAIEEVNTLLAKCEPERLNFLQAHLQHLTNLQEDAARIVDASDAGDYLGS